MGGVFLSLSTTAQTPDGTSCAVPKVYPQNVLCDSTTHTVQHGMETYWILFTATAENLVLSSEFAGGEGGFSGLQIYSGSCSGLVNLETINSFNIGDSLDIDNLVPGQDYYLQFNVNTSTQFEFKVCLKPKNSYDMQLFIVDELGDTVYICNGTHFSLDGWQNNGWDCDPLTVCIGDTLCLALNMTNNTSSNVDSTFFLSQVSNPSLSISSSVNADSTYYCLVFNETGTATFFIHPEYPGLGNPWAPDNTNNSGYWFSFIVVDQTPPAETNSDGLLCVSDTFNITAYPGSVITSVTVDNGSPVYPNSSSWNTTFAASGEHVIEYTVSGYCYPVTYFDTVHVIKNDSLTVVNNPCNQLAFTFVSCTTYPMIVLNFSDGNNVTLINFAGDTTLYFDYSGIGSPINWTFEGSQQAIGFPPGFLEVTYAQSGVIDPVSPQAIPISGPSFLCELGDGTLSIPDSLSYSQIVWTSSPSAPFTGQGTSMIDLGNVSTTADLQISVYATDSNHCIYSDSVIIEGCCIPDTSSTAYFERKYTANANHPTSIQFQLPSGYYNGPTLPIQINLPTPPPLNNAINTVYSTSTTITDFMANNPGIVAFGTTITTNNWIFINNDLIINQNVNFQSCDFIRLAPGVRIIVQPGCTFQASRCTFAPKCAEMWGGILTSSASAIVWLDDVSIISAEYGIEAATGGAYKVQASRFIDNLYGIYVHDSNSGNGSVVSSYFGDVTGQYLLPPYQTEPQPLAGIRVKDIGGITVGDGSQAGNLFHNMQRGITALRSTVRSFRNNFHNIKHAAGLPSPNEGDKFCAIYAANSVSILGLGNHTLFVNESSSAYRNNFVNCEYGISVRNGMNLEAHGNYMKNCIHRGISAEDNRFKTLNVYTNEVNSSSPNAWGIYLKNYNLGTANVLNNQINLNNNTISGVTRFSAGIYTSSISPVVSQTTMIKGNTINNCLYGIWMINTTNGTIDQNAININMTNAQINNLAATVAPVRGIVVQNSHKAKIWNNTITRNLGNGNGVINDNLQGIRLELSPASEVWKNSMTRTAVGFYALGSNMGSKVECNQLNYNRNGFWMQAADISNQGSAPVQGYPEGISAHNAWTGNFANNSDGTTIGHSINDPLRYYHRNVAALNSSPTYNLDVLNFWDDILLNGSPATSCGAALNPAPIVLTTPAADRNRQLLDIVSGVQLYDSLDQEMKHYLKHSALSRLKSEPGLQSMNTPEDSLYQVFIIEEADSDFDKSLQIQEKLAAQQYDSAQFYLSQFITNDQRFSLIKQVEEIWNQQQINNLNLTTIDTLNLMEIACLDPIQFGSAVYQARSVIDWDGFCSTYQQRSSMQYDNDSELYSSITIYPNPAENNLTVESSEEIKSIKFLDLKGVEVLSKFCDSMKEQISFNLTPGIYFVEIQTLRGLVDIKKISVY